MSTKSLPTPVTVAALKGQLADARRLPGDSAAKLAELKDTTSFPAALDCLRNALQSNAYSYGCLGGIKGRLRTIKEADEFFGALNTGGVVALSVGSEQSALYTEIVSDNIWVAGWAGFARVGASAQIGSASATDSSTVSQFFQGGGNAVLYAAAPIARYLNFARPEEPMLVRRLDVFTVLAIGADVPKMGASNVDLAGNLRVGLALQGHWNTNQSLMRFFVDANGHVVQGLSPAFYKNLTGEDNNRGPFLSGSATIGVDLRETVRLGIRFAGSGLVGQRPQFTAQFLQK